jgi:hypothetical protein
MHDDNKASHILRDNRGGAVTQPHHSLSRLSPLTGMYGSFYLGAVFIVDCL